MNADDDIPEIVSTVMPDGTILHAGRLYEPWPTLRVTPPGPPDFAEEILRATPGSKFWPAARRIPDKVRHLARLVPSRSWSLVELCAAHLERGLELTGKCPALALIVTGYCARDWQHYQERLRMAVVKPWRQLLADVGLPARPRTIRLLRKVGPAHCRSSAVSAFCRILREGHPLLHVLPHLPAISRDTIALLEMDPRCVSPALLRASARSDWDEEPVAWLLSSVRSLNAEAARSGVWPYPTLSVEQLRRLERRLRATLHPDDECFDPFPPPPVDGIPGRIEPLRDYLDLVAEGEAQVNCAASYGRLVAKGRAYVFAVHHPERATLALRKTSEDVGWFVDELRTENNASVRPETEAFIAAWLCAAREP